MAPAQFSQLSDHVLSLMCKGRRLPEEAEGLLGKSSRRWPSEEGAGPQRLMVASVKGLISKETQARLLGSN